MIGILLVLVFSTITYKYLYHSHKDIKGSKPDYTLTTNSLLSSFVKDENKSNLKYLDKIISLKGKVTSIDKPNNYAVLDEKSIVSFSEKHQIKLGDIILVKGRFIGYDSLLEELKLDQCSIEDK